MKKLFFLMLMLLSLTVTAGESSTSIVRYTITSFITMEVAQELEASLIANPSLKEIELRDSFGAYGNEIEVTNKMIALIDQYKLNTYARGICAFACATIFLSGYQRTLLVNTEGKATQLTLRPIVSEDDEFLKEPTEIFFKQITLRSEGKIPHELLPWLYKVKDEFGGIHIRSKVNGTNHHIQFQSSAEDAYQNISNLTPADLGMIVAQ